MRLRSFSAACAAAAAATCAIAPVAAGATEATPRELVEACRTMIPADVEAEGRIILRNRRGIVQAEYSYALARRNGETSLLIKNAAGEDVPFEKSGRILGTDVTWSDLTLDYLWWDDFSADDKLESETVHGQTCAIVLMKKDERTVRVWVDEKTGAMMQAEELRGGQAVRRLWGTRIKKFGERWAPNVLEVETLGSGHRTKITVEKLT
ncbi:MAG: outer membrane lipoprotein-sorting protein [Kiritimatiellae bacterium]|nr:outer membrane lipoprotein-sorting protein [Kiritimatiellia bacterium]